MEPTDLEARLAQLEDLAARLAQLEDLRARLIEFGKTTAAGRVILRRLGLM